ncbi:RNA-binding (RRM/RBD/RNP motifs) family protein [Striga hermonthica]|uniref:RNA-binding (RRM/RBD/RNP motifs) family protein n=1 Tax=Striga hermonthica TaxID=68872 RepID=A0A9N7RJS8_STRHE|nr:RNA-binding (RRM/RBD/RNP motifs) family protein [Striga hermonthica]
MSLAACRSRAEWLLGRVGLALAGTRAGCSLGERVSTGAHAKYSCDALARASGSQRALGRAGLWARLLMSARSARVGEWVAGRESALGNGTDPWQTLEHLSCNNRIPRALFTIFGISGKLVLKCSKMDKDRFFARIQVLQTMFYRGKYADPGDPREMGFKRQRLLDHGPSSYYTPGPSYMYVEVFRSRRDEYYRAVANEVYEADARGGSPRRGARTREDENERERERDRERERGDLLEFGGMVRMRGLPYSATRKDVVGFFEGFGLTEGRIHLLGNGDGRPAGEAIVEFGSAEESREAVMAKDRRTLGSRYIELFPASREDLEEAASRGR